MRLRWAIALAVLLALAGCSGLPSGDDVPDRTPYGVEDELESGVEDTEDERRDPNSERIAPGLTTDGVDNASLLVERHYETLEAAAGNRTYVVRVRETWTGENGSEVRRVEGRFVVESSDRWSRTTNASGSSDVGPTLSDGWAEDGRQLLRYERPNGEVHYHAISASASNPPLEGSLRSILVSASEATVEAEPPNATTRYRVTANASQDDGVRNLSFVVRDDGVVERLSFVSRSEHWPNASTSRLQLEFTAPGPESLERPDWYEEALAEIDTERPGNGTDDGRPGNGTDDGPLDEESDDEPDDGESSGGPKVIEVSVRSLE